MSKPVVLVHLEDGELKTEVLQGDVHLIVADFDNAIDDHDHADDLIDEIEHVKRTYGVGSVKLGDVERRAREILAEYAEDEDDDEDFDDEEFDEDDFDDLDDEDDEEFDDEDDDEDDGDRTTRAYEGATAEDFGPVS